MADETKSDAQARQEDAARVGAAAVETRAVGGEGTITRPRRAVPDGDVEFAASRGIYRDTNGRRRVVGAGQPVPDGWERIETADVNERDALTNLEDGDQSGGAGDDASSSSSRSRSKSK